MTLEVLKALAVILESIFRTARSIEIKNQNG